MKNNKQSSKNTNLKFKPIVEATTACLKGFSQSLGKIAKFQGNYPTNFDKRREAYTKQQIAKSFLKGVKNSHRFHNCLSAGRVKNEFNVSIYSNSDQTCTYKGLQTCGSRSACPLCSIRLCEMSRQDVLKASNAHLKSGGGFALFTLTIPHTRKDKLSTLVRKSTLARNKFNENDAVKYIFKKMKRIGYVRGFENKHGAYGWHPHQHFLFYLESTLSEQQRAEIQASLLVYWQLACVSVGLKKPNQHGLDFMSCSDPLKASAYIVKDAFEVTYSNTKGSKRGSVNPFDLLSNEPYKFGSRKALFREYYKATKGLAMVYWSRGLKKLFNINTTDNDEQAIYTYDDAQYTIPVVELNILDWKLVRKYDLRCDLLEYTEDFLKSKNLISIFNYDEYIKPFFNIFSKKIAFKKKLELKFTEYVYHRVDEVLDSYLSFLAIKNRERKFL
jgi:hypothetical protein